MGTCPNCGRDVVNGEVHLLDVDKHYCEVYHNDVFLYREPIPNDPPEVDPEPEPAFYCVAIVHEVLNYGGPEEGGWWYHSFEPAREYAHMTVVRKTEAEILKAQEILNQYIIEADLNHGRRPITSVLSTGQYTTMIYEDEYPTFLPKERPHYE